MSRFIPVHPIAESSLDLVARHRDPVSVLLLAWAMGTEWGEVLLSYCVVELQLQ